MPFPNSEGKHVGRPFVTPRQLLEYRALQGQAVGAPPRAVVLGWQSSLEEQVRERCGCRDVRGPAGPLAVLTPRLGFGRLPIGAPVACPGPPTPHTGRQPRRLPATGARESSPWIWRRLHCLPSPGTPGSRLPRCSASRTCYMASSGSRTSCPPTSEEACGGCSRRPKLAWRHPRTAQPVDHPTNHFLPVQCRISLWSLAFMCDENPTAQQLPAEVQRTPFRTLRSCMPVPPGSGVLTDDHLAAFQCNASIGRICDIDVSRAEGAGRPADGQVRDADGASR